MKPDFTFTWFLFLFSFASAYGKTVNCAPCTIVNPLGNSISIKAGQKVCLKDNFTWEGKFYQMEGGEFHIEKGSTWHIQKEDYTLNNIKIYNVGTIDFDGDVLMKEETVLSNEGSIQLKGQLALQFQTAFLHNKKHGQIWLNGLHFQEGIFENEGVMTLQCLDQLDSAKQPTDSPCLYIDKGQTLTNNGEMHIAKDAKFQGRTIGKGYFNVKGSLHLENDQPLLGDMTFDIGEEFQVASSSMGTSKWLTFNVTGRASCHRNQNFTSTICNTNDPLGDFDTPCGKEAKYNAVLDCTNPPAKLVDFSYSSLGQNIYCYWKTHNEFNIKHYILEESLDGKTFEFMEIIEANNKTGDFSYASRPLPEKTNNVFYRLAMVSESGKTTYSEPIEIQVKSGVADYSVYPNPAKKDGIFKVTTPNREQVQLHIYNLSGQLLTTEVLEGEVKYTLKIKELNDLQGILIFEFS